MCSTVILYAVHTLQCWSEDHTADVGGSQEEGHSGRRQRSRLHNSRDSHRRRQRSDVEVAVVRNPSYHHGSQVLAVGARTVHCS